MTPLCINIKTLQEIASFFQLGTLVSSERIPQGMNNPSFLVCNTNGQEFVIRILEKQTLDGIKNEYFIEKQLIKNDIACPTMMIGNNRNYFYINGNITATVSKKIEGYHPGFVDEAICGRLGKMLARFHITIIDTNLPTTHKGWLNLESAQKNLSMLPKDDRYKKIILAVNTTKNILTENFPRGVIHGDFIIENVLFGHDNTITAILDFDESEENVFLLDIAKTILGVCIKDGQIDRQLAKVFLASYNKIRKITKEENEYLSMALLYVIGVCATWFIKNGHNESANKYLNVQYVSRI